MRIFTLLENTQGKEGCVHKHGLSLLLQTEAHSILMDAGPDQSFIHNAHMLGADLAKVDFCVLSHGHYDHSGGIMDFADVNPLAPIYMQRTCTLDYYADDPGNLHYIGIDKKIAELPSAVFLDGDFAIDGEVRLLTHSLGTVPLFKSNARLKQLIQGKLIPDLFSHEQVLSVCEKGKYYLFSGCSHRGVLNWLGRFIEEYGRCPDVIVGGFHFMAREKYSEEEKEIICKTAKELIKAKVLCYTGHCTGEKAFSMMKEIMGRQLQALHSGMKLLL